MSDALVGAGIAEVMAAYRQALAANEREIDRLNVFPVPDGDTGTNMTRTLDAVLEAIRSLPAGSTDEAALVADAVSKGSLMGARGNSGVILCQILRGLVAPAREVDALGPVEIAAGLTKAADGARAAVLRPVEGTMLSVCDAAAAAARSSCEAGGGLADVLSATREAARAALWATPSQLPVLAEAGVVDAGGAGLLLLFDALLEVSGGEQRGGGLDLPDAVQRLLELRDDEHEMPAMAEELELGQGRLGFEVMFFLEAPDDAIPSFKAAWAVIGESIVVVGGDGLWNCHIHTDDIGAAIEAGIDAGRPRQIQVTDLQHQVEEEAWVRSGAHAGTLDGGLPPLTSVVAVGSGVGVARIFSSLGAERVVAGGQSMNPSTAEVLAAIEASSGGEVVVLPNNSNTFPVAAEAAKLASKPAFVVSTRGIQEGFAALLAYDPAAKGGDNARLMGAAAEGVVAGEVTKAVRAARTAAGPVRAGDWIGLSRRGIESTGRSLADAATALLEKLLQPGCGIVTLIAGADAPQGEIEGIECFLAEQHPEVEVERLDGGQPLYPLLISVE